MVTFDADEVMILGIDSVQSHDFHGRQFVLRRRAHLVVYLEMYGSLARLEDLTVVHVDVVVRAVMVRVPLLALDFHKEASRHGLRQHAPGSGSASFSLCSVD